MLPINGKPLIGHTIQRFVSAGIRDIVIIFNEDSIECARYAEKTFSELNFDIIIKTTLSSFESFLEVGRRLGSGRHLISTVDSICLTEEFVDFKEKSEHCFSEGIVLAVTSFVDDEKPLWVEADKDHKIITLSDSPGKFVTAGMYVISDQFFSLDLTSDKFSSLRQFLKEIVERGELVYACPFSKVIDVDRVEDVTKAEMFSDKGDFLTG